MVGELLRQPFVGAVVLGDHQKPRRLLVDAVDDAGAGDSADAAEAAAAMMEQGVDHGAVAVSGGRVDDQPGGLVDDQQMLVLVKDRQRNFLRLVMGRLRFRDGKREALVALHLDGGVADRAGLTGKRAGLGQHLQPLARQSGDLGGERTVEPPAGLAGVQRYFNDGSPPGHLVNIWVSPRGVSMAAKALLQVKLSRIGRP